MARKPRFIGKASAASSMRWMFQAPGAQVVAAVPVAGPVPPPIRVVSPAESASSTSCGQMKWIWLSMPPAVTMRPSPAITSVEAPITMPAVTPAMMSGLPALPDGHDAPGPDPDVRLHDAPVVEDQGIGDHQVQHSLTRGGARGLAHAVADHLPAAELHLVSVGGEVALDLDEEIRIREANPVADGGAIEIGVLPPGQAQAHEPAPRKPPAFARFTLAARPEVPAGPSVSALRP